MMRVRGRERNQRCQALCVQRILIDRRTGIGECKFWAHRRTELRGYVPMTDLSILCLHNSTTSLESQQRGGIVEVVIGDDQWVAVVVVVTIVGAVGGRRVS